MKLDEERASALLAAASGILLAGSWILRQPTLAWASCAVGALIPSREAWGSVRQKQLDVNVLMLLAAVGSLTLGMPHEAAVLLFLFTLSAALEGFALGRTKSAIEGLMKLRPDTALKVEDGGEREVSLAELRVGDTVKILPFQSVPVDGAVLQGESEVNEASMTGEAAPRAKAPGEPVWGGTQNLGGTLWVRVKAEAGEAALDKVVALVSQAQEERSGGQRISAWFGSRYTFFVIGVFLVVLVARLALGQDAGRAFYASLTVFVALSPCALVIAAPAASLSALAWGAKRGLLIRGADVLEKAASARWLALDKTGTLTRGRFTLARAVIPGGEEWREGSPWPPELDRLRGLATSVEAHSTHPLAEAFLALPSAGEAESVSSVPGKGLSGMVGGTSVSVGQAALFPEVPLSVKDEAVTLQAEGLTTILCQADGKWAVFGAADAPREEAKGVLTTMKSSGIEQAWMLTGDSPGPAWRMAESLPLDGFRASLLPADKERLAGEWEAKGGLIYVGDGINDAPTLARASVGVAMGGLGSDVALNAANVVLMKDSLEGLSQLRRLGQASGRITRQSLYFAGGVVVVLFIGSFLADALLPESLRRIILPLAVVGHEGSTVLVILNGLRLLWGPGQD